MGGFAIKKFSLPAKRMDPEIGYCEIFALHFRRALGVTENSHAMLEALKTLLPLVADHIALGLARAS
jgi:hypothetical protein